MLTLPNEKDGIAVENWTKWQVYVRQSPEDDTPVVVYAQTSDTVAFQNKVSIWRTELRIHKIYVVEILNQIFKFLNFTLNIHLQSLWPS